MVEAINSDQTELLREWYKLFLPDTSQEEMIEAFFSQGQTAGIFSSFDQRRIKQAIQLLMNQSIYTFGDLTYNRITRRVRICSRLRKEALTLPEHTLFLPLIRGQGDVVTHSFLSTALDNSGFSDSVSNRRVIIRTLRKIIDAGQKDGLSYIGTINGVGYKLYETPNKRVTI